MASEKAWESSCACGDLTLVLEGTPLLVSSCSCTRCQRRTGSFFGVTVYYRLEQLIERRGAETLFRRPGASTTFHFCPRCGSNVWWEPDDPSEGLVGVAGGSFSEPIHPSPERMVHANHKHPFVRLPEDVVVHASGPPE